MKRLLLVPVLVASLLPGCFTVAGGLVGSQVTTTQSTRLPSGEVVTTEDSSAVGGAVVGALLDAALIAAILTMGGSSDSCFSYGPGEGGGACGDY